MVPTVRRTWILRCLTRRTAPQATTGHTKRLWGQRETPDSACNCGTTTESPRSHQRPSTKRKNMRCGKNASVATRSAFQCSSFSSHSTTAPKRAFFDRSTRVPPIVCCSWHWCVVISYNPLHSQAWQLIKFEEMRSGVLLVSVRRRFVGAISRVPASCTCAGVVCRVLVSCGTKELLMRV